MPNHYENKENDKKGRKRPLNPGKSRPNDVSETSVKRKKTVSKQNVEDAITKSKQLSVKLKKAERTTRTSNRGNEIKICGNGKPMPPLAVLEKMFEDSDSDKEQSTAILSPTKSCQTSTNQTPVVSEDVILSPTTVDEIASRVINKISNISDPSEIFDVLPPPPVVPQKKVQKSSVPYIVGCKDRPQVIKKTNTNFCKGSDDYGINLNATNNDENLPKKRKKRLKKTNVTKSIFNAQSEEISTTLKINDESSNSSTQTITYDYFNPVNNKPRAFSPLPSTSKDNDTIMKNEKLFSESLSSDGSCNTNNNCQDTKNIKISNNEITKDVDKVVQTTPSKDQKTLNVKDRNANTSINDVEIIETPYETIDIDDMYDSPMTIPYNDDSLVQIVEPVKQTRIEENSIIDVDDYYSSLNFNRGHQPYTDDVEIIDIDSLTAESNAVLKNLRKQVDKVTVVEPSCLRNSGDDTVTEIRSENTLDTVLTPANPNNGINQQSTGNNSDRNREINITSNSIIDTPNRDNCNTQHNSYPNDNIPTENEPCAVLTEENVRIHNSLQPKNHDSIGRIVSDFFNNNQYVPNNTNMETIIAIPQHIRNVIANMHRILSGVPNNDQSDPRTANTNNNNLSRNVPSIQPKIPLHLPGNVPSIQSQIPSQPPAPSELPPTRNNFGDCPICMDSLFNNTIASTTCGHLFCMGCIQAALRTNGKRCPTCRTVLKGKSYHQIFI